jgi:hypothetical protein
MRKVVFLFIFFTSNVLAQITVKSTNQAQAFLPVGFVITQTIHGDLNNDGLDDDVFIIKATLKSKFVKDEMRGLLDRNRRGIMVVFNKNNKYELAYLSRDCFSSENEDGGVYFPPELHVFIEKGNLLIHFAHGRYGYWRYNFRYQNSEFELIGYDSEENSGPTLLRSVSINLLTKKMLTKTNINPNYSPEKLKSKWSDLNLEKSIKLGDFKDFDACKSDLLQC